MELSSPSEHSETLDLQQVKTLVPLKDMGSQHLNVLLDFAKTEYLYSGQTLFNRGSVDECHLYLLYGDLLLEDEAGNERLLKGRSNLLPLVHHRPRRYQATAASDCAVLRFPSDELDKLLTWSQVADYLSSVIARDRDKDEDELWMSRVLQSNLFYKVPPLNVDDIFSEMKAKIVDAGEVILRQGEIGSCCYFIKEGRAEVTRQGATGMETLAQIGPGRCFGEDALVNDAPRNATVTMQTDGVLMCLPKQAFYRLLKSPEVPTQSMLSLPQRDLTSTAIIDVRSDEEYALGHLPGAVNIPLHLLGIKSRLMRLGVHYLCYCNTGRRSRAATHLLRQQGYTVSMLTDAAALFERGDEDSSLETDKNYILREGLAVVGQ
ncbi:cyclic nucleotide-binding domain-containing protein [Gilvimarinus xylanilyticus]|uniref:Cyclic nucleotide-binding domain-containing protein n=1 Tax=Gilvimarinus xylanilyticus TaxID=2944139 RepID=A0A9X2HVG2_9GAMM|nr:cyclic nucleotide-binding domain-containing protein [Gilvimarinus xylanilyticus]MCP8898399.1 cyclic nucleotide-binding domain-containing protein [Gilvimarinus xylanilyticus]